MTPYFPHPTVNLNVNKANPFVLCISLLQSLLSKSSQPFSTTKIRYSQKTLGFGSAAAANCIQAPSVNVNPFTPATVRRNSELQWRSSCRSDDDEDYGRR